jgi:nucleotide-binding universal stress UspA family protein
MYKKILVPLDGSELAEQVLPHVIDLAARDKAQVVLLRVPDAPIYQVAMPGPDFNAQVREQGELETRLYLDHLSATLRLMGLQVETVIAQAGAIYLTILQTAKDQGADLIAMSTHGRSGLARLVMGSVADDVVRHAELPVLLVRPKPVHPTNPYHVEHIQSLLLVQ